MVLTDHPSSYTIINRETDQLWGYTICRQSHLISYHKCNFPVPFFMSFSSLGFLSLQLVEKGWILLETLSLILDGEVGFNWCASWLERVIDLDILRECVIGWIVHRLPLGVAPVDLGSQMDDHLLVVGGLVVTICHYNKSDYWYPWYDLLFIWAYALRYLLNSWTWLSGN